ncbi:MAG TPA: stage V sporulation protein AE [Symbiobacteriaceae bacterium]|nr:stage V sporulation protein AE [Symbiobacteriaceae bacterium]
MKTPVRVILITDGDKVARRAMEYAAGRLGLRCISASAGNPTPLSGHELVELIKQAAYDPVLVMVDDKGNPGMGAGEKALAYICQNPDVQVLGAIAVASNTRRALGAPVDVSITRDGRVVEAPVDKHGLVDIYRPMLRGDTVDVLRELNVPVVIGIGDPGKMEGADCVENGCEVTTRAIMEVLARTVGQVPEVAGGQAESHPRQ